MIRWMTDRLWMILSWQLVSLLCGLQTKAYIKCVYLYALIRANVIMLKIFCYTIIIIILWSQAPAISIKRNITKLCMCNIKRYNVTLSVSLWFDFEWELKASIIIVPEYVTHVTGSKRHFVTNCWPKLEVFIIASFTSIHKKCEIMY